jgi:hypothetical protein
MFEPKVSAYVEEYRFYDKGTKNYRLSETRFITKQNLAGKIAMIGNMSTNDYRKFKGWISVLESADIDVKVDSRVPFPKRTEYRKGNMYVKRIPLNDYEPGHPDDSSMITGFIDELEREEGPAEVTTFI